MGLELKNNGANRLYRSYQIFSLSLFCVFFTFMLDVISDVPWVQSLGLVSFLFLFILKIFLYCGMYGVIVEISSGERIIFGWGDFKRNAKKFWKLYLCVLAIPAFVYFLMAGVLPENLSASVVFYYANFYFIVLFLLAYAIVYIKYVKPLSLKSVRHSLTGQDLLILLSLYLLDLILFYLPRIFYPLADMPNLLSFFSESIEYFQFTFLALIILGYYPQLKDKFDPEKEIFMIGPHGGALRSFSFSLFKTYPPIFIVLKAFTPKEYNVRVFNQVAWKNMYYKPGKLVAITYYTSSSAEAYKIAKGFQSAGSKVIMGGPHARYFPDEALEFCDSVLIGDAENIWGDIVKDFESGNLKKKYFNTHNESYSLDVHNYQLATPPHELKYYLETVRGCKFHCHFCAVPALNKNQIRKKPIEKVVELIKKIRHYDRNITFIDNNIFCSPEYSVRLFTALEPLKIKWRAACSVDIGKDEAVLDLAQKSGCVGLLIGYEIAGNSHKKELKGKFSLSDRYALYTERIKKRGIHVQANFMFGFDSDTWSTLIQIWRFAYKIRPHSSALSLITPLPGSGFYYDLVRTKRLKNMNWRNFSMLSMVFEHPKMDDRWVTFLFPYISIFYLLTSSKRGILYLFLIIFAILFFK